jgi:hypothetical protein
LRQLIPSNPWGQRDNQPLMSLIGVKSFNVPNLTEGGYIELVDFTGREWRLVAVGFDVCCWRSYSN